MGRAQRQPSCDSCRLALYTYQHAAEDLPVSPDPTKKQQHLLTWQLEECRWLWNMLLAERKQAWEDRQENLGHYEQKAALPGWKADERPSLKDVIPKFLQDVVLRVKKRYVPSPVV